MSKAIIYPSPALRVTSFINRPSVSSRDLGRLCISLALLNARDLGNSGCKIFLGSRLPGNDASKKYSCQ